MTVVPSESSTADVGEAAVAAGACADAFRRTSPAQRAVLLDRIAVEVEALGDELLDVLEAETALPRVRLESERGRTTGQLRLFAAALREGTIGDVRIDGLGEPGRSDLRSELVAIGPVAVFGASNFPLAFSTAGGDTAAALAAGCPVVVKAHPAHVRASTLVADAIAGAVNASGLPVGTFGHVIGGEEVGVSLVSHPCIRAVTFTGSRSGGLALQKVAAARPMPIPTFAEMSSVNPVFVLPGAARAALAPAFVQSLTLGAGQFCTNPGLLFVPRTDGGDAFVDEAAKAVSDMSGQPMLTPTIAGSFSAVTTEFECRDGVRTIARGTEGETANAPSPILFETDLDRWLLDSDEMQAEMFGAAALIVRYDDLDDLVGAASRLHGQLTVTVHHGVDDHEAAIELLAVVERLAGRLVSNGWPTGVEVTHAMTHGGPFPATTDARFTSVGTRSVLRFLRPVTYQGFPEALLPATLQEANPFRQRRSIDGRLEPQG